MSARVPSDPHRTQRFRDAALPYLDDAYTLARYLLRNPADAEDAVQECFLRALTHFDSFRGPAIKPWLLAILRNICFAELARRNAAAVLVSDRVGEIDAGLPPDATGASPEAEVLRRRDASAIRDLIERLPAPFREAIVLREMESLSYREIAEATGVPVGTVMSRLARARAMLRTAWMTKMEAEPHDL